MQPTRTWRLAANVRAFHAVFAAMLVVAVIGTASESSGSGDFEGDAFFLIWCVFVLGLFAYQAWNGVTSITLQGDRVILRGPFRNREALVHEVVSVEASVWDLNRFQPLIRTRQGTFRLVGPFNELFELLTALRERNPAIQIRRI